MAKLEIRYLNGDVETVEITKRHPVSIGSHASNDIQISEDDVAVMHCRIAWNTKEFEVTAANVDGVDLNGTFVHKAPLRPGDVLRVGSVDIGLEGNGAGHSAGKNTLGREPLADLAGTPTEEIEISPASGDDLYALAAPSAEKPTRKGADGRTAGRAQRPPKRRTMNDETENGDMADDFFDDIDEDGEEESVLLPDDIFEDDDEDDDADVVDELETSDQVVLRRGQFGKEDQTSTAVAEPGEKPADTEREPKESLVARLRTKAGGGPRRPGEHDIVRSPFVIALGVGTAVLALVGAVFWFMIARETANRLYDAALAELNQGKYKQAIVLFDQFLEEHPHHKLLEVALIGRSKALVEQQLNTASPNWKAGLENVLDFIDDHRDRQAYPEQRAKLYEYGEKIAVGAAEAARVQTDRELIKVSEQGSGLMRQFSPADQPPVALEKQIEAKREAARAAIVKQETFDQRTEAIAAAISSKQPMTALDERRNLLQTYPEFLQERAPAAKLTELLDQTLKTEQSLVAREELKVEALTDDHPRSATEPLSLTLHTRSRTDETSIGRTVIAVGKDCCYGIDSITGDPVWRRVIGLDPPFFPISVDTSVPGVLIFDTNHKELALLEHNTGNLLWRQPIGEQATGRPLIHQGEIYLTTDAHHLFKIDLDRGRVSTRLRFSQATSATPVVVSDSENREWLAVAGDRALVYTLSLRPLECVAVAYQGHAAGSIRAPLVKMGRLTLLAENHRENSCLLHPLRFDDKTKRMIAGTAVSTPGGQVHDQPMLWGKSLFVPSRPERITAYTISDDPNQQPLTRIATYQLQNAIDVPMHLYVGPDDQLWLASSALRKLYLQTDSIKLDAAQEAVGLSTQPLQSIRERMYVGRQLPFSQAVLFSQIDREQMTGHWRTVLGSSVLAVQSAGPDVGICVTEGGDVFRVRAEEISAGGFKEDAAAILPLPDGLTRPLRATTLSNGTVAIDCGQPAPQLWTINALGQASRPIVLDDALDTGPVALGNGLILPLPGRLKYLSSRGTSSVQDFLAPVRADQPRWVHLEPLDETQLVAAESGGALVNVQLRDQPTPHLAEVLKLELAAPLDVPFAISGERLFVADGDARFHMLDAANFDTLTELSLKAPATQAPWVIDGRVLLEIGGDELMCFSTEGDLREVWTLPLGGISLAGAPLSADGRLLLARRDGAVWTVDFESGSVVERHEFGQPLALGPKRLGGQLILTSVDGSLHSIESVFKTAARAGDGQ